MTMNHCITPGKKIKFKINFKPTLKPPPTSILFFKAVLVTWKMIIMIASYFFLAFPINLAKSWLQVYMCMWGV